MGSAAILVSMAKVTFAVGGTLDTIVINMKMKFVKLVSVMIMMGGNKPRPFPPHKTFAEKKCGIKYEECRYKFGCENGEECWYDSEDYWYDCGKGAPTLDELKQQQGGKNDNSN